jgi:NAD(P)-dependent dehydrogenase (short-subunit alcohol dehydrogenase family)
MDTAAEGIAWKGLRFPGLGDDSVVLVAGGGGAIGARVAAALVELGAKVAVCGRSLERLQDSTGELPDADVLRVACDIGDAGDCRRAVAATEERFGPLSGMVNCAAVGDDGVKLEDLDEDVIDQVLRINLRGPMLLSQAAAASIAKRGGGSLVHVGSVAAWRAQPGGAVYGVSKAGLARLVGQLAVELGPVGIRVNLVSPGQTPTVLVSYRTAPGDPPPNKVKGTRSAGVTQIPLRRIGRLDDVAGAVAFFLSDLSAYVTGADLPVEGGAMWLRVTGAPAPAAPAVPQATQATQAQQAQ